MGDTITLNFTPEQYKFFLDSCIEEVNRVDVKGKSLHVESWAIVGKKMKEKFGLMTTQKQLKNKFDYYRGKHQAHAYLRGKTGTGNLFNAIQIHQPTDEEWRVLNQGGVYEYFEPSSLKTSPLQHYDLCDYLFTKVWRHPFYSSDPLLNEDPLSKYFEVEDVSSENGGYWAQLAEQETLMRVNSSFEGGRLKNQMLARGRKKKRSKKDSELLSWKERYEEWQLLKGC
ncbi:myb/SANT-like domain-containing protein [Artemisia annua]|uniref:Myb/SANT-like domain-containing protein n=1 Tax=Artemisia annua TaxID=35608 RepID=A0A2U1N1V4_ARTAN|nr:myb/SANT-like domain-containing protein [Artemisia annua]